ncbi:hypothetical protein PG990_013380 [Apiospora arundinis]|uniref:F-box domain-containing protein n=1 Tax=Apiospora arundinis TaxID=335852 RepID=A0ABR2HTW3_9PEZI
MAGLEDLPNELLLELLYQCHPRAALALVTALPPVFRAFRWQRSNIIHLYQQRLSVVLMEAQCDSTDEFEERVRYNWRLAVSSAANLSHNYFIEDWPSDLPMLAVMADICSEVDFLVEKVRLKHWDAMLKRVNTLRSSSSYATVPRPEGFGPTESWLVQVGLLYYERYCPMHYHETRILPPDMEKTRFWPHTNFFTSIRFVCNIHWNILLDVLDNEPLRRIFPHTQQARDDAQEMIDDERCMRLISIFSKEKTQFLRYLCSFGIHFASVVGKAREIFQEVTISFQAHIGDSQLRVAE